MTMKVLLTFNGVFMKDFVLSSYIFPNLILEWHWAGNGHFKAHNSTLGVLQILPDTTNCMLDPTWLVLIENLLAQCGVKPVEYHGIIVQIYYATSSHFKWHTIRTYQIQSVDISFSGSAFLYFFMLSCCFLNIVDACSFLV